MQQQINARPSFIYGLLLILSIALPIATMAYKLFVLNYSINELIPAVSYQVDVNMQVDGHGDDIELATYLPKSDTRQSILEEQNASGLFSLSLQSDAGNRIAHWQAEAVRGTQVVRYTYSVLAHRVEYLIPTELTIPANADAYPQQLQNFLKASEGIQVDDPMIANTLDELFTTPPSDLYTTVYTLHRYLQDQFENRDFSGFTDALTALKLKEASCNGKGRLFVALLRKLNIPARLVGGLIMQQGSKRTSHQWIEAYINGHWVPFDTINDHFASLPANYLTLYYGDQFLYRHTTNVNFQYTFKINKRLVPKQSLKEKEDAGFNILDFYTLFEQIGISQNLLKILIMIPVGAFVVVVFRNVIGLETFGTFLPALIAAASRETGLLWGLIGFGLIILITSFVRKVLDWVHMLHSPKMAVLLTTVVILLLSFTVLGVNFGLLDLAHISLFPIAILAITAERFAILETEQGWRKALSISAMTAIVIAACYMVMDSLFLQSMFLAFPELLLLVIALNLWLGKWIGMRLSEFIRFRRLIFSDGKQVS